MLLSIILGVMVTIIVAIITQMLNGGLTEEVETRAGGTRKQFTGLKIGEHGWGIAIGIGALVGVINYFTPQLYTANVLWLAPVFFAIMIALMIGLMVWWQDKGSEFKEMIPFILLTILLYFTAKSTAWMTTGLFQNTFWTSFLVTVPVLLLIAAIGFFIIDAFYFRFHEVDVITDEDDDEIADRKEVDARRHHTCGIIAIIVTTLLLIVALVNGVNWSSIDFSARAVNLPEVDAAEEVSSEEIGSEEAKAEVILPDADASTSQDKPAEIVEETEETPELLWYYFCNSELLSDKDEANDYNFGPNPIKEGLTAEDYDKEFRRRLSCDPALAAADMAWLDANVGTRYTGRFYESCKGDWAETINLAKCHFMYDQEYYYNTLDSFYDFLDHAYEVSVERGTDLDDQMYMNPFTVDGVPDVVVFETLDHEGLFLVYKFNIKGSTTTGTGADSDKARVIEVAYRIDCGFQPTNVEEVMKITPKENPNTPEPTPEPKPTPKPTPKPDPEPTPEPDPEPEPTPKYEKDPSKAPKKNTEPNDNKGPGESTNNGKGAKESTKDQPTNSNHYSSYEEYKEDVKELKDTNQTQKTGKDSNTPSTPKPSTDTKVDNNGDKGTSTSAPINTPTQVTEPAKEAGSGDAISDSPGEPWGGPPD